MTSPPPVFRADAISKRFGGIYAVRDVSFDLSAGEIVGLLGANGAGKSTLLKIISGALRPDAGQVVLGGKPLRLGDPVAAANHGIASVYQELSLLPHLTVAENLCVGDYPAAKHVMSWRRLRRQARELFTSLEIDVNESRLADSCSLADKYLIEIAKAVRRSPRILILDEPTAALDTRDVARIFNIIRTLEARGTTIIFVSHRLEEVVEITKRVVVMRDGQNVGGGVTRDLTHEQIISMMAAEAADWTDAKRRAGPRPIDFSGAARIGARNVTTPVLRSVNFEARRGEIVGLAGLRGSGRTELCELLAGAARPERGHVTLDGEPAVLRSPHEALRRGIGFVPAERKSAGLFLQLSVTDNVTIPVLGKRHGLVVRPAWAKETALRYAGMLQIKLPEQGVASPAAALSGGNQQKVVLAKCLAARVDVLVLDEPTRGVDIATKPQIYSLLQALASEGMTVIVSCSELPELYEVAQRIVVLHRGEVSGEVEGPDFDEQRILAYAMGTAS